MATHAGDAVDHRRIARVVEVAHDVDRTFIQLLALGGVQVIGLETVGQAEDGLAAVVIEAVGAARSEWEFEQALLAAASGEVIRGPEVAVLRGMALDQAVMRAHARLLEAGALCGKAL